MRRVGVFLADHAHDLGQFLHQVLAVLQAPRRIDHQKVRAIARGLFHGVKGKAGGVRALGCRQHRHTGALTPDLKLFDGRGAEGVAGGNDHLFSGGAELAGQFADGGGLARAVYTDHQHDLRLLGIKRQGAGHRFHHAGDFLGQQPLDLIDREFFTIAPLGHVAGDAQRGIHAHVRRDEQLFELFEHVVVQFPAQHLFLRAASQKTAQKPGLGGRGFAGGGVGDLNGRWRWRFLRGINRRFCRTGNFDRGLGGGGRLRFGDRDRFRCRFRLWLRVRHRGRRGLRFRLGRWFRLLDRVRRRHFLGIGGRDLAPVFDNRFQPLIQF